MKDVMVDLETLSTQPTAAIVSIGARVFDLRTFELGPSFYQRVNPDLARYAVDLSTVKWWLTQNEAARTELAGEGWHLFPALEGLRELIDTNEVERVWALPPTFDVVILENAYRLEYGVCQPRFPWAYNATRCVRTVCDLAGLTKADRVKPTVEHNALADCDAQIATLKVAFAKLGLPRP